MNKNIASWLLKDLQRKDVTVTLLPEAVQLIVSTVQNILRQVAEFEYCLELLSFGRVPDAVNVVLPFAHSWSASSNMISAKRARDFLQHYGLSISRPPPVMARSPPVSPFSLSQAPGHSFSFSERSLEQLRPLSSADLSLGTIKPMSFLGNTESRVIGGRQSDVRMWQQRLLSLLTLYPKGIVFTHLPEVYLKEFHEPMTISIHRVKEILQACENVQMIHLDSPGGDKLIRIFDPFST